MTRAEFETLLWHAGEVARDRHFFLIGSQALRGICPTIPRDFPKTFEADLYPRNHPQAWAILRTKLGRGSQFFKRHGYFLDCTDPGLSTLPDGWLERLIPFRTPRTRGITAWCLEPHDLFVSKLVAWREKDQMYLAAMLKHRLVKASILSLRIEELAVANSEKEKLAARLAILTSRKRRSAKKTRRN
jgi:hypothetical protein